MGRADVHCHTSHSGFTNFSAIPYPESVTSPADMVDAAARAGLDVICITDHNTIKGARIARRYAATSGVHTRVVMGEEITTSDGELLGIFIEEEIPQGLSAFETVDRIHSQGGLAIAPHPFSYHCPSLGDLISSLKLDGIEILNAGHRDHYVNRIADMHCNSNIARIGSSDAHTPITIGNAYSLFEGESPDDLFKAIKNCRTVPEGHSNSLGNYIGWSVEMAQGVSKRLMIPEELQSPDDPLARMYRMRSYSKAIALIGSAMYVSTPLPIVAGIVGEGMVRYKGRKKWGQVMGYQPLSIHNWMMGIWRHFIR